MWVCIKECYWRSKHYAKGDKLNGDFDVIPRHFEPIGEAVGYTRDEKLGWVRKTDEPVKAVKK